MVAPSRICSSCRTPVSADAAFCMSCGAPTPTDLGEGFGADFEPRLGAALADRYRVVRELGRGGMAIVFLADDLRHERQVAIKVLRPELAAAIGGDRFNREIKLAAKLNHPHIVPLHDSGEADGFLYYVMPFVEGESLRDRLRRERQLPIADALQVTKEVAEGLDYAHEQGVIHRDIKPENILLSRGHPLIADFGIAKAVSSAGGTNLTSTGTSIGTPSYMSPEQAGGDPNLDGRTDVYSLGCVLYEMLAGEPPFTGPNQQAIMAKHALEPRPSVRVVRDTVPEVMDQAIQRAMAKVPADRYGTGTEFVEALARKAVEPTPKPATVRGSISPGLEAAVLKALEREPADRFTTAQQFADALRDAPGRSFEVTAGLRVPGIWRYVVPAAVLALVAIVVLTRAWPGGAGTFGPPPAGVTLAVFPFRALGDEAQQWSEALGDLLATALDGTPDLTVADPWSLWQGLRPELGAPARSPDVGEASRLARAAGANRFVLASVVGVGGQLQVTLRTYALGSDDALRASSDTAPADSLLLLAQRLAVEVIASVLGGKEAGGSAALLERVSTRSVGALKAYLQAREAMRRGQVADANTAIDRALALDSTFGLALIEAPVIKSWVQFIEGRPYPDLLPLAERAVARSDPLSERSRLRSRAVWASILTRGGEVADAAERMLRIDSTDFDAWSLLAYGHQAYGWQYGATIADAVRAADRVVTLDPAYIPGLVVRAELAASLGDAADQRRQLERLRRADTTRSLVRGTLLGLELLLMSPVDFSGAVAGLTDLPQEDWIAAFRLVRFADPAKAETLGVAFRRDAPSPRARRIAGAELARLWLAHGRVGAVDSVVAERTLGSKSLERTLDRFLVAASVAGLVPPAAVERAVLALSAEVPLDSALSFVDDRAVIETGWVLAAFHAVHGDRTEALRWQRVFDALPPGGVQRDYRGALRADIDARLAARDGNLPAALAHARRAFDLWSVHVNSAFEDNPELAMRLHLAALFRRTGLADSGAAVLRSLTPPASWSGFYTPLAARWLGEITAVIGDSAVTTR